VNKRRKNITEKSEVNDLKNNFLEKTLLKLHKKLCQKNNEFPEGDLTKRFWSGKMVTAQQTLQRLKIIWMK